MNVNMQNKDVFITGGTGSVGKALVQVFSECNGKVFFQYHNNEKCSKMLKKIYNAVGIKLNFEKIENLPELEFDVVINNAGVNISKDISQYISNDEWEKTLSINLLYPFNIIRKYLPNMVRKKWGRIINISSIYGLRGSENNLPYNVSKHGLSGLTKTIAKEYAQYGITCNEICPGPIESKMMQRIAKEKENTIGIKAHVFLDNVRESIPAKCMASPLDIAYIALFLASDYSGYINGISIPVDGALIA